MLAGKRRMPHQHAHRVIDGVIGMRRHAVWLVRQALECPIKFFAIIGKCLNGLYTHAEGHQSEDRRMLGQAARKFAHSIADPGHLFGSHAAREIKREDDRHRARRAFDLLDIERSDRTLGAVFVKLEILSLQVSYQPPPGVSDSDIYRHQVSIDFDDVLRLGFGGKNPAWAFLCRLILSR